MPPHEDKTRSTREDNLDVASKWLFQHMGVVIGVDPLGHTFSN